MALTTVQVLLQLLNISQLLLERARRRLKELREKGLDLNKTVEEMAAEIAQRDHNDSTREFAPLVRLPEAVLVDTTDLTIDEAVAAVMSGIKREGC